MKTWRNYSRKDNRRQCICCYINFVQFIGVAKVLCHKSTQGQTIKTKYGPLFHIYMPLPTGFIKKKKKEVISIDLRFLAQLPCLYFHFNCIMKTIRIDVVGPKIWKGESIKNVLTFTWMCQFFFSVLSSFENFFCKFIYFIRLSKTLLLVLVMTGIDFL